MIAITAVPRWLKLALLPLMGSAVFCIDYELKLSATDVAIASRFDAMSSMLLSAEPFFAALLAAGLLAYPLARIYEDRWKLASAAVVSCAFFLYLAEFFHAEDPFATFLMCLAPLTLAIALPAISAGAHRAMGGSRLVVVPAQPSGPDLPLRNPIALQLLLLPTFAVAFFIINDLGHSLAVDIALLPDSGVLKRIGLLCAQLIWPTALGAMFALPVARVYGRKSLAVSTLIVATTVFWAASAISGKGYTFVANSYRAQLIALAVMPPLLAALASHRLRESGLKLTIASPPGKAQF